MRSSRFQFRRYAPGVVPLAFLLCVLLSPLLAIPLDTPLDILAHDQWTPRDGLPASVVSSLEVSRTGHLWVGTEAGLGRFDGTQFRVFSREEEPGLPSNVIFQVVEGRDGAVWVATSKGLALRRGRHFETLPIVSRGGAAAFWIISADDSTGLWAADKARLFHLTADEPAGTMQEMPEDLLVRCLLADGAGGVWCGGGKGLYHFSNGTWQQVADTSEVGTVFALCAAPDGSLLVGGRGLHVFSAQTASGVSSFKSKVVPGSEQFLVTVILRDRDGALWLGTRAGLYRQTAQGFEAWYSRATGGGGERLQVYSLAEDSEGSLWVGTTDTGLYRLRRGAARTIARPHGLSSNSLYGVLQTRDGAFWFAGDGGLDCLRNGVLTNEPLKGESPAWARSLYEDSKGNLWVGGMRGIHRRSSEGNWTFLPADNGRNVGGVRTFIEDSKGRLWAGSSAGLAMLQEGAFVMVKPLPGAELEDGIYAFARGPHGEVWAGGQRGVGPFQDGVFTPLPGSEACVGLSVSSDGTVWAGQIEGGFLRIREGGFERFSRNQGLTESTIMGIGEDAFGMLWMTSNHGVLRIPISEINELLAGRRTALAPVSYGYAEGMVERECNAGGSPALALGKDGSAWAPTIMGVVQVESPKSGLIVKGPKVFIEEVSADGVRYDPDDGLSLPPGTRQVALRFSGVSLSSADKLLFHSFLDGAERSEAELGHDRTVQYVGLSPGDYTFRVRAQREDGRGRADFATLVFSVRPHFWQTRTFLVLVSVLCVALLVLADRLRQRSLRLREEHLKSRVAEEMAKVKVLSGLLPVCAWCSNIRDDEGGWLKMEDYISKRSQATFTHGMCPKCLKKFSEENGLTDLDLRDE